MGVAEIVFWSLVGLGFWAVAVRQPRRHLSAEAHRSTLAVGARRAGAPQLDDFRRQKAAIKRFRAGKASLQGLTTAGWMARKLVVQCRLTDASRALSDDEINDLIVLCDESPEEGLGRIDALDADTRRNPWIMFARLVALRRLVFGPPDSIPDDIVAFVRSLDRRRAGYANAALTQIGEIERAEARFFVANDDELVQLVLDGMCLVNELLRAGAVQRQLGWTKVFYFGPERVLAVNPDLAIAERLGDVPVEVSGALLRIRFTCAPVVRSAVAVSARHSPRDGWMMLVALFESVKPPTTGRIGNKIVGFLTLAEGGRWRFDLPN